MGTADAARHHRPWVTQPSISSGILARSLFSRKPAGARVRAAGGRRPKSWRDFDYPTPSYTCAAVLSRSRDRKVR